MAAFVILSKGKSNGLNFRGRYTDKGTDVPYDVAYNIDIKDSEGNVTTITGWLLVKYLGGYSFEHGDRIIIDNPDDMKLLINALQKEGSISFHLEPKPEEEQTYTYYPDSHEYVFHIIDSTGFNTSFSTLETDEEDKEILDNSIMRVVLHDEAVNETENRDFDFSVFDNIEGVEIIDFDDGRKFITLEYSKMKWGQSNSRFIVEGQTSIGFNPFILIDADMKSSNFGIRIRATVKSEMRFYNMVLRCPALQEANTSSFSSMTMDFPLTPYFNGLISLVQTGGGIEGSEIVVDERFKDYYDRFKILLADWQEELAPTVVIQGYRGDVEYKMTKDMVETIVEWYEVYLKNK